MATLTKQEFEAKKKNSIIIAEESGITYITGIQTLPLKEGYNENIKVFIMLDDGTTESVIVGKERHAKLRVGEATWVQQKFAKSDKYEANTKWSFDNV